MLFSHTGGGFDGTSTANAVLFTGRAANAWTSSSRGASVDMQAVKTGSTIPTSFLTVDGSSNVAFPSGGSVSVTGNTVFAGNGTPLLGSIPTSTGTNGAWNWGVNPNSSFVRCYLSQTGLNYTPTTGTLNSSVAFVTSNTGYLKYDPLGLHNPSSNPSRVTITLAGTYRVTVSLGMTCSSNITYLNTAAYKNGTAFVSAPLGSGSLSATFLTTSNSSLVTCAVGDYIEQGIYYVGSTFSSLYTMSLSVELCSGTSNGLPTLGAANQLLRVNSTGTQLEYGSPHTKMGADFTAQANPTRVFKDIMWMSGSNAGVRTWTPTQIPWVYADITAAELACIYWIQKITTFFKGLENDTCWDQLIGSVPAYIVSRITGNVQSPDSNTDMDFSPGSTAVTTYSSEWFELIVGRNVAGTELYTMSFTVTTIIGGAYPGSIGADVTFPFRMIWQTTRGTAMTGFNGQTISNFSTFPPKCTQYGVGGVTIPALGFPLWAMPVSLETMF